MCSPFAFLHWAIGEPGVPSWFAIASLKGSPPEVWNDTVNPYGFPAKDRSGRLDLLEPPHLGALIAKCAGTATPIAQNITESKE